jgi:hypothetical protein
MMWPQVKNSLPHHSAYSCSRMREVWLNRWRLFSSDGIVHIRTEANPTCQNTGTQNP